MSNFSQLLKDFAAAVEVGDGKALAALFTEDGVYDDIFYGEFHGRAAIRDMVEKIFWRDAREFLWEFRNPVASEEIGYASWLFSYTSTTKHNNGRRCGFEGVGVFHLRDGSDRPLRGPVQRRGAFARYGRAVRGDRPDGAQVAFRVSWPAPASTGT